MTPRPPSIEHRGQPMRRRRPAQHGMTLIEMMVAMVLGLLIVLAAAASLLMAREGFTAVDAASQLRDNGRFLQSLVQRLGAQTGYRNLWFAIETKRPGEARTSTTPPDVFGLNNSKRSGVAAGWSEGVARTQGEVGYGSDILVLRYQTSTATENASDSDKTMIDCAGIASTSVPTSSDDRLVSILHVDSSVGGEPALMCSRSNTGATTYDTQPVISGVESFQVLYGVDGVNPGNATTPTSLGTADSVPERYLRADQLTVAQNQNATYANWRRVRSIRIGVVLRGEPGSAIDRSGTAQTFYPFGISKGSASGTAGSAFASSNDPGTEYTPAIDGRLRQTVTFTVHLRNAQDEY